MMEAEQSESFVTNSPQYNARTKKRKNSRELQKAEGEATWEREIGREAVSNAAGRSSHAHAFNEAKCNGAGEQSR